MSTSPHGALRVRDFRMLLGSVAVSEVGTQVSLVAIPLVAVLTLGASPFQVGLLTTAEYAAFLLIGLPAGAWLDRMRRRPVMIATDALRGVVLLSIPIAAWLGVLSIWQLYGVALALGFVTVFFDVAAQSYLPFLIGREHLLQGNSRLETVRVLGRVAGPGAGGGLVQMVTAPIAVLADAISYLGSAVLLAGIRVVEPRAAFGQSRGIWLEMREGLAFVLGNPILRAIAGCSAIANLFFSMAAAVQIVFLVRVVQLSPGQIGVLTTAAPLGGLIGGLVLPRLSRRIGTARVIWVGVSCWGFGTLMPLAAPGWRAGLFAVGMFAFSLGAMLYNVSQITFRQSVTPEQMLGRVNATIRCVVWGALPLGGLIGGALGETLGLRLALWVAVLGGLLSCVPLLLSPLRRMRDI